MPCSLTDLHPTIQTFHRGLGAILKKGFCPAGKNGRRSDGLVYILKGQTVYDFGEYAFEAQTGDILYLAKGSIYSMDIRSQTYEVLIANFDFYTEEGTQFQSVAFPAPGGKSTEQLFRKLVSAWHMRSSTVKEECLSSLYAIYADLLRVTEEVGYLPTIKRQRMENATQYINEHLHEKDLSVADIAKHVHLSESYFRSSFKEAFSLSPVQYINMQRISRIKERLRYTADPISKIADHFGFSSVYHFCHLFKKEVGCTPSEYRSKHAQYPKT